MKKTIVEKLNELRGEGHSGQIPEQQKILAENVKGKTLYLETGFNLGHSALTVLEADKKIKVVSFDIGGVDSWGAFEILHAKFGDRLTVIWGDSTKTVPSEKPMNADFVFIDGGHQYETAKADLLNMRRHMKPDAHDETTPNILIDDVFCDARFCVGPTKAWVELIERKQIIEHDRFKHNNRRGFALGQFRP